LEPTTANPTPAPVPVCAGEECFGDNNVFFCLVQDTGKQQVCITREAAEVLLAASPLSFCGQCDQWDDCSIAPCGNNNNRFEICHYIPSTNSYGTICVSGQGAGTHLDSDSHCDYCGPCFPLPPPASSCPA
jgi:hypothetical protein